MKVIIQRHGIVIKSVPVSGDRASIGSSPDANVVIDDPYLAAQVADIVKQADGWHLIDSGTSMEGITRDGQRIEDDLVVPGQPYSLGGFELVIQLEGAEAESQVKEIKRKTAERAMSSGTVSGNRQYLPTMNENISIPHTMMETELPRNEIPKTMFETPMPAGVGRQAQSSAPINQFQPEPQQLSRPVVAAPVAAPVKKPRRLLLLGTAFGLLFLLLLIIVVGGGKKEKPKVEVATTTTPVPTATVAPVAAVATPSQELASLRYDEALAGWERQLAASTADAETKKRYAELALEVGRIHAANGSSEAAKYFANVVKYGAPDSPAVAEAKKRIAR